MKFFKSCNNLYISFFTLLLAGLAVRLFLSRYLTYGPDLKTFKVWADTVGITGFGNFYNKVWCDYMPGYIYVLWFLNKLSLLLPSIPKVISFKIPPNIADFAISLLVFYFLRRLSGLKTALAGSLLYFFNPAIIANSTFWGQMDSLNALAILFSVILIFRGNYFFSGIFAAFAFMLKSESMIIFPLLGIFLILPLFDNENTYPGFHPRKLYSIPLFLAGCITILLVLTLPFVANGANSLHDLVFRQIIFLHERFSSSYDQYKYASVNAFNFWGMFAMWKSDQTNFAGVTYRLWGIFIFVLVYIYVLSGMLWLAVKKRMSISDNLRVVYVKGIVILFLAQFLFLTRVYERQLLAAIVFLSMIFLVSRRYLVIYCVISVVYVLNLYYSYLFAYPSYSLFPEYVFTPAKLLSSLALILIYFVFLFEYIADIISIIRTE